MSSSTLGEGPNRFSMIERPEKRAEPMKFYDLKIKFLSAKEIPKTNISGHFDPYFIAEIDQKISVISAIKHNTRSPEWENEEWRVIKVTPFSILTVKMYNKDEGVGHDDFIGEIYLINLHNYQQPKEGHPIRKRGHRSRGYFHLTIEAKETSEENLQLPMYTFDGPCRYSRHDSLFLGQLTMLNSNLIYSTWKIFLCRIPQFFPSDEKQHWNEDRAAAKFIFNDSAISTATQTALKIGHKILYRRTLNHNQSGLIMNTKNLWSSIFPFCKGETKRLCIYTYIIDDHTWRFSQANGDFLANIASKHALLANGSECVKFAGEFHAQPKFGWDRCNDEWELVFDNASGTYTPDEKLLKNLEQLLKFNFPELNIVTYRYDDPALKECREKARIAIAKIGSSTETIQNLVLKFNFEPPKI